MLTLPLMVSRDRVTGGLSSDFSSICQPITVMFPTRSLSADLQQATCSGKWCGDCAPLSAQGSAILEPRVPGSGRLVRQAASTACPDWGGRLEGRGPGSRGQAPRRSAGSSGEAKGRSQCLIPGLPLPQRVRGTHLKISSREPSSGTRPPSAPSHLNL